jgi:hypothetical protein
MYSVKPNPANYNLSNDAGRMKYNSDIDAYYKFNKSSSSFPNPTDNIYKFNSVSSKTTNFKYSSKKYKFV